jgi:SAM-dependent methyltransferase
VSIDVLTIGRLAAWGGAFFLWHFALRRLRVVVPTRTSAQNFVGVAIPSALWDAGSYWRSLGVAAGAALLLATGGRKAGREATHFDTLAPDYATQLSPDARARVVARKTELTLSSLHATQVAAGARVLDVGCGHGWYLEALARRGFRAIGVDRSLQQLRVARRTHARGVPLVAASATALPFAAKTVDGALAVNVLHHLEADGDQVSALLELVRVVRPDRPVLVHEINTRNPLFRFYMVYVFPLLKRIDLGTERWLDARRLPVAPDAALEQINYFTFLPDFTPPAIYRLLAPLEAALEQSGAAPWSAHFTAHYRVLA